MNDEIKCFCQHCKKELPQGHKGLCPYCGDTKKSYIPPTANISIGLKVSAHYEQWREYTKNHPFLIAISFILSLVSPIVGYLLAGCIGIIIGVVISILAWCLGLYAREKISELISKSGK